MEPRSWMRGLLASHGSAAMPTLFKQDSPKVKTLIDSFEYPERGPGQMWETLA